jgi:hypothetical protein
MPHLMPANPLLGGCIKRVAADRGRALVTLFQFSEVICLELLACAREELKP